MFIIRIFNQYPYVFVYCSVPYSYQSYSIYILDMFPNIRMLGLIILLFLKLCSFIKKKNLLLLLLLYGYN